MSAEAAEHFRVPVHTEATEGEGAATESTIHKDTTTHPPGPVKVARTNTELPPIPSRPLAQTLCLFDVDGTLTPARQRMSAEMQRTLLKLRGKCAIGTVGGSDFEKQQEQLGGPDVKVTSLFDYVFAENGLTAFRQGDALPTTSFIEWLGEDRYKQLVNFILHYIAIVDIPIKRGTFVEFRNGMINVSPIGRNATRQERVDFEAFDKKHHIRKRMVEILIMKFGPWGLAFSIGGQISFDVFPKGWDKTYCLRHIEAEKLPDGTPFTEIHFFGDKTEEGGNDYEIYHDKRVIGHAVKNPEETMELLDKLFNLG